MILLYYDIIIVFYYCFDYTISETFTSWAARPVIPKRRLSRENWVDQGIALDLATES